MKLFSKKIPSREINTLINSYDIMGFKGLGTFLNEWLVAYVGTKEDYDRLSKVMKLSPFVEIDIWPLLVPYNNNYRIPL